MDITNRATNSVIIMLKCKLLVMIFNNWVLNQTYVVIIYVSFSSFFLIFDLGSFWEMLEVGAHFPNVGG